MVDGSVSYLRSTQAGQHLHWVIKCAVFAWKLVLWLPVGQHPKSGNSQLKDTHLYVN